jgi:amidase
MSGLVAEHAVTRSVRDSAALLDATSGPDLGDPYWAPTPARPFVEEAGAAPGRLRIAFTTRPVQGESHADCVQAVQEAAQLCRELGHDVREAAPDIPGEQFRQIFLTIWQAGCSAMIDMLSQFAGRPPSPDELEPLTWAMYERGKQRLASDYLRAVLGMQQISRRIARFWLDYDVWLTPTVAEPPPPLGTFAPPREHPLQAMDRAIEFVPFTPIANATGQPAMSLPLSWNAAGLPIGTHFVGRFGDEATLFRLAAQLEAARPWANRRPPVCAESSSHA